MFLDIRYNIALSSQETIKAKEHLVKTWKQLIKITTVNDPRNEDVLTLHQENVDFDKDEIEILMKILEH